jgi:hypothetical protein
MEAVNNFSTAKGIREPEVARGRERCDLVIAPAYQNLFGD